MLILRSFVNTQRPFSLLRKNLGSLDHNDAHATRDTRSATSSNATIEMKSHARTKKPERRDANAGEAIPRLPNHLVVTHVLRSEYFDDPADLTRLPAVSRAMRDAVAATGLRFKEIHGCDAARLGCLSAVQRLQRGGCLSRQEFLCWAAARGGNLKELKGLRENGCPWHEMTCMGAAMGGHLDMLQWARANSGPWNEKTCEGAARGGQLEVLQWLRANGCPWDAATCTEAAGGGYLDVLLWARANGCPCDEKELCVAAEKGHEVMVRALIDLGAVVNKAMDTGATPLYVAAQNGHEAIVRTLFELGADVNKTNDNGVTPLFNAAENGHATIVQIFTDAGAA